MAEKSPYGQKVLELCTRRGIYSEKKLADKLEAIGYGKAFDIKNVKHHLNRALQRKHISSINFALHAAIIDALELTEPEQEELVQAGKATGRLQGQDEREKMRVSTPIRSASEVHYGLVAFY